MAKVCDTLISGSSNYQSAVAQTKSLFPDGLCCMDNPDLTTEQVLPVPLFSVPSQAER